MSYVANILSRLLHRPRNYTQPVFVSQGAPAECVAVVCGTCTPHKEALLFTAYRYRRLTVSHLG